jgi:UDP-N-acetyl-D-mannosaminuronic acid dehydrogenase
VSRSLYGSRAAPAVQREWFKTGDVPVAVYGLGKMGLPLAAVYAENSGNVTGVDIDDAVVAAVADGDCPVQREPGLPSLVESLTARDALEATTDSRAAARQASVHVVIVPTVVDDDNDPDLSAVTGVARDVAAGLDPGDVVFVESTVPPRTCVDVLRPLLEDASGVSRHSFGLAFCPERTSSGRALADIRGSYPKIVGGVDDESTRVAGLVYSVLVDNDVIPVADATTAEAVKVFEGLYRDVNIALANDLARLTDELGIEVRDAIDAANTQPYCDIHTPGPGVGGHCIPYYPYFVLQWLQTDAPTLSTARRVNDAMPEFVADRVAEGLAASEPDDDDAADARGAVDAYVTDGGAIEDRTVAVLGLTYRAGVAETRASPGVDVCELLADRGATVYAADPLVDASDVRADHVAIDELHEVAPDAAVLVTPHDEFEAVDWTALDPLVVVDGHDALDVADTDHRVYTVGRGWK